MNCLRNCCQSLASCFTQTEDPAAAGVSPSSTPLYGSQLLEAAELTLNSISSRSLLPSADAPQSPAPSPISQISAGAPLSPSLSRISQISEATQLIPNPFPTIVPAVASAPQSPTPSYGQELSEATRDILNSIPTNTPKEEKHFTFDLKTYGPHLELALLQGIAEEGLGATPIAPPLSSEPIQIIEEHLLETDMVPSEIEKNPQPKEGAVPENERPRKPSINVEAGPCEILAKVFTKNELMAHQAAAIHLVFSDHCQKQVPPSDATKREIENYRARAILRARATELIPTGEEKKTD